MYPWYVKRKKKMHMYLIDIERNVRGVAHAMQLDP